MPPWEMMKQPAYWRNVALKMESDEAWAQEQFNKKAAKAGR